MNPTLPQILCQRAELVTRWRAADSRAERVLCLRELTKLTRVQIAIGEG
jgi:hypothetical protein